MRHNSSKRRRLAVRALKMAEEHPMPTDALDRLERAFLAVEETLPLDMPESCACGQRGTKAHGNPA